MDGELQTLYKYLLTLIGESLNSLVGDSASYLNGPDFGVVRLCEERVSLIYLSILGPYGACVGELVSRGARLTEDESQAPAPVVRMRGRCSVAPRLDSRNTARLQRP